MVLSATTGTLPHASSGLLQKIDAISRRLPKNHRGEVVHEPSSDSKSLIFKSLTPSKKKKKILAPWPIFCTLKFTTMKKTVATFVAVTGMLLVSATKANAAIILVTTPLNVTFAGDTNPTNGVGTDFAWNIDGFGSAEFTFTTSINHSGGADRIFMSAPGTTLINKGVTAAAGTPNGATRQLFDTAFGTNIAGGTTYLADTNATHLVARATGSPGSALLYSNTVVGFTDSVPSVNSGYISFSFAGDGGTKFGWAHVTFSNALDNSGGFRVIQAAYGNAGETLTVGQVPEPSTYALAFGALALGIAAIRRRRS